MSRRGSWVDGEYFPSQLERKRYEQLKWLEKAGKVKDIRPHPKFRIVVNGVLIGNASADFQYKDENDRTVVEDVKSPSSDTQLSRLKRKLVKALYDIEIEVI